MIDINANHVGIRAVNCQICQQSFLSNNNLHCYLCLMCGAPKQLKDSKKSKAVTVLYVKPKKEVIVALIAPKTNDSPGNGFYGWQYTTANM